MAIVVAYPFYTVERQLERSQTGKSIACWQK